LDHVTTVAGLISLLAAGAEEFHSNFTLKVNELIQSGVRLRVGLIRTFDLMTMRRKSQTMEDLKEKEDNYS